MNEAVTMVKNALLLINDNGLYFELFLLALVVIFVENRREMKVFLWILVLALAVLLCPVTAILISKWGFHGDNYYRNFVFLPMTFAIAYAAITLVFMQKTVRRRIFLIICLAELFFLAGKPAYTNDSYRKASEQNTIVEEADQIFAIVLLGDKTPALIAPDEILSLAEEEYPDKITIPYSVEAMNNTVKREELYDTAIRDLYDAVNYEEMGMGKVVLRAREYHYPFIAFSNTFESEWPMTNGGYEKVLETEHYVLYKDTMLQ